MHSQLDAPHANDNETDEAGLFSWDLSTDTLYADGALADLFGLDAEDAARGLPLSAYIDRIWPDDRAEVARAIAEAIKVGTPFQQSYAVMGRDGAPQKINAFGQCFRDRSDVPQLYSGIVFPVETMARGNGDLAWLCCAAIDQAAKEGRADIAEHLKAALIMLRPNRQREGQF